MQRIPVEKFERLVHEVFDEVLERNGVSFLATLVDEDHVKLVYRSNAGEIHVERIIPDYEPRVRIALRGDDGVVDENEIFDLYEVINLLSLHIEPLPAGVDRWRHMLGQFCAILTGPGLPALVGSADFYARLRADRESRKRQFVREEADRSFRAKADALWQGGDKSQAGQLYSKISQRTESEEKKIAMWKRLNSQGGQ